MKKIIAAVIAVTVMAFSAVPAFAAESETKPTANVESPVATVSTKTGTSSSGSASCKKDCSPVSPKTGSDNTIAFSAIALTASACGAATLLAVKKAKSK